MDGLLHTTTHYGGQVNHYLVKAKLHIIEMKIDRTIVPSILLE